MPTSLESIMWTCRLPTRRSSAGCRPTSTSTKSISKWTESQDDEELTGIVAPLNYLLDFLERVGCECAPDMKLLALFANFLVVAKEKGILVAMDEISREGMKNLTNAIHENLVKEEKGKIAKPNVKEEPPDDASSDKGTPAAATAKKKAKKNQKDVNLSDRIDFSASFCGSLARFSGGLEASTL